MTEPGNGMKPAERGPRPSLRDQAETHFRQGVAFLDGREAEAAADRFRKALELEPDWAEAQFNLGIAFQDLERLPEAAASYEAALKRRPDLAAAHYNLALLRQEDGRLDEAVGCYRRALELTPDFPEGWNNLGTALQDQEDLEQAAGCFLRALALRAGYADAHYNLGSLRHRQGRLAEAIESYRQAVERDPRHHKACNNMGKAFQDRREIEQAAAWYRRALAVKPDYAEARFNLATVQLLAGDFEAGFANYESRFDRKDWRRVYPHRLGRPRWAGEPFTGKRLYVHGEQGFGDMLQFVRYLPQVKALGGTVILEARQALMPLFRGVSGVDRLVLPPEDSGPRTDFDLCVPLLSLPHVLRTTAETIPHAVPYLEADPLKAQPWRSRVRDDELRVGLVWAGTSADPARACSLAWFTPITRLAGVRIYGLQKGPEALEVERRGLPGGMRLTNWGLEFEDFSDTAAAIENLDLVVSIDTSVAHLAGAMGKPVWLLLSHTPDWRWGMTGEGSPWYPTMRLYRQESHGSWGPPLTRIARGLEKLARSLDLAREIGGAGGLLAAAAHFQENGGLPEALIYYQRVLREHPEHPEALHGMGLAAYETGNAVRAVAFLRRAIAARPDSDRLHHRLGLALVACREPEKAAQAFRRACELNPGNADARHSLSTLKPTA